MLSFVLAVGFFVVRFPSVDAHEAFVFRIGASIGEDGPCAPLYNDTVLGYQFFFDWLAQQSPFLVTDASGKTYSLRLQLRLVTHDCTEQGRAAAMTSLIQGEPPNSATGAPAQLPVHLLLGGHGDNALEDALQANNASRILLHCCTARDTVFRRPLPHVYGMFTPASLYTGTVLRTMALRGMQRVAVVYSRESLLHAQLCEGALAQLEPLGELRPGFRGVLSVNYSEAEAEQPGFWQALGAQVEIARADVLIACDGMNRISALIHELRTHDYRLSALWLASDGDITDFVSSLDGRGEYALTSLQWMPNLPYADSDFGTAAKYAEAFTAATGRKPSYFSAAATASGYVLLTALRKAVQQCSLGNFSSETGNAADAFMWSENALTCMDAAHRALDITGSSGTAILRYIMSALSMDTFFGPVGFNGYHQNIFHPVIVAQVLDGELVTVLPLDVADRALVMPINWHKGEGEAEKPWPATAAGISVITLLCGLGLVSVVLGLLMCRQRAKPQAVPIASVEIRFEDVQVDIPPQINADGSCEPGEGVYRGTRVKLVVAQELMLQQQSTHGLSPNIGTGGGSRVVRDRGLGPLLAQPSTAIVMMEERELGTTVAAMSAGVAPESVSVAHPLGHDSRPQAVRLPSPYRIRAVTEDRRGVSAPQMAVELTEATPAGSGGAATVVAASGGGFMRQSDSELRTSASSTMTVSAPTGGGGASRWLAAAANGFLAKRSRRQILALVWRAVRLQHPRMCPMLGIVWEWPGLLPAGMGGGAAGGRVPVLVRQWHEFDSLDRLLENETVPLPLLTKATIAQGVAEGLAYLHAQAPPIFAGPMDASRVIIDKDFNPHLFLRLLNLEPEYGSAVALAADAYRHRMSRGLSLFGSSKRQHWSTSLSMGQVPCTPQPSSQLQTSLHQQPSQEMRVLEPVPSCGGGGGGGGGVGIIAAAPAGCSGVIAPAPSLLPPQPYQPSKDQDVYEFGLLLCSIFLVTSGSDSGWLNFAMRFMHVAGRDEDPVVGGGSNLLQLLPTPSVVAATAVRTTPGAAPLPLPAPIEEESINIAVPHLRGICPELADLAKACLQREPGLTFNSIAQTLESKVIPSLTCNSLDAMTTGFNSAGQASRRTVGGPPTGGGTGGIGLAKGSSGVATGAETAVGLSTRVEVSATAAALATGGLEMISTRGNVIPPGKIDRLMGTRSHHALLTPDDLIYDLFPPKVARALQTGETVQPERYDCVSIFFSDVVGYTDLCGQLQPGEVMDLVHRLYSRFDDLIRELRLFKVETVGDAYLAVANLRWPQPDDHAVLMTQFAFAAMRAATSLPVHPDRPELGTVHVRVGLHCGPVVGSVVGTLNRRYCLFGDAVNTAARMEHNSLADRINCSGTFAALLREQSRGIGVELASRGVVNVKGKGSMELFWVMEKEMISFEPEAGFEAEVERSVRPLPRFSACVGMTST